MNKVKNLESPRSGKTVSNQFEINVYNQMLFFKEKQHDLLRDYNYRYFGDTREHSYIVSSGRLFQSYNSLVCFIDYAGRKFIDERFYKYSRTTSKYLSVFLGRGSKEIEKLIKAGEIRLCRIYQG